MEILKHTYGIVIHGHDVHNVERSSQVRAAAMPLGFFMAAWFMESAPESALMDAPFTPTMRLPSVISIGLEAEIRRSTWKVQSGWWEIKMFCETTPYCLCSARVS